MPNPKASFNFRPKRRVPAPRRDSGLRDKRWSVPPTVPGRLLLFKDGELEEDEYPAVSAVCRMEEVLIWRAGAEELLGKVSEIGEEEEGEISPEAGVFLVRENKSNICYKYIFFIKISIFLRKKILFGRKKIKKIFFKKYAKLLSTQYWTTFIDAQR